MKFECAVEPLEGPVDLSAHGTDLGKLARPLRVLLQLGQGHIRCRLITQPVVNDGEGVIAISVVGFPADFPETPTF